MLRIEHFDALRVRIVSDAERSRNFVRIFSVIEIIKTMNRIRIQSIISNAFDSFIVRAYTIFSLASSKLSDTK